MSQFIPSKPSFDLYESKDSNVVLATFDLLGVKSKAVTTSLHQNHLTVSGDSAMSNSRGGYAVRERRYGGFSRMLQDPFGTKPEGVKAKIDNGPLTFRKADEQQP